MLVAAQVFRLFWPTMKQNSSSVRLFIVTWLGEMGSMISVSFFLEIAVVFFRVLKYFLSIHAKVFDGTPSSLETSDMDSRGAGLKSFSGL